MALGSYRLGEWKLGAAAGYLPEITLLDASEVSSFAAKLCAYVEDDGGTPGQVEVQFRWRRKS